VKWPPEFFALKEGVGCLMCANAREDDNGYGIRFYRGRVANAFLQRAAIQPGYTIVVWAGPHVVEPTELTPDEAGAYWADVLTAGRAIEERFEPLKMNYETLGNALPHLHTHVVPRYEDDPRPGRPFLFPDAQPDAFPEHQLREAVAELKRLVGEVPEL
jgi:diadenosine tetraphosphate (Ap4A) HIT family hydrolase